MKKAKKKTLIAILTAVIILLIPIVAMAIDPPALLPKTGHTTCYDGFGNVVSCEGTGQDGEYQTGISSPNPRFTDNGDNTVKDNLTGLVWLKNAGCFGARTWANALTDSNSLNNGECGLTDGSVEGDWRLPNIREMQSLIDYENYGPALPTGHPFINVSRYYWQSTILRPGASFVPSVDMSATYVEARDMGQAGAVWPVRGPDRDDDGLDDHKDNCPTVSNPDQKDVDSNNIGDICDPNTVCGTISGDVQSGVSIKISSFSCGETNPVATTTTNVDGYYAVGGLSNGEYGIEPKNSSYLFNPELKSVVIPQEDVHAYNFAASEIFTISGTVSGDIQKGVTITLSGDSCATTITASDGRYGFTGLVSGSYTITPSKTDYTFDSESTNVAIIDSDVTGVDFISIINPCLTVDRFLDITMVR
jgi:hypothetical protein